MKLIFTFFFSTLFFLGHLSADVKREDLYGSWVLDAKKAKEAFKKILEENSNDQETQIIKMMLPKLDEIAAGMVITFNEKEVRVNQAGQERTMPYEFLGIQGNSYKVKSQGREQEMVFDGESMYINEKTGLSKMKMYMKKISEKELKARLSASKEAVEAVPGLAKARLAAQRTQSNHFIRSFIQGVIISTNLDTSNRFRNQWAHPDGIRSTTKEEKADLMLGNETLMVTKEDDLFYFVKALKGKQPFGGYYIFKGAYSQHVSSKNMKGRGKRKGLSDSRVVLEIYDWEKGDGKIAIGFGDGHVVAFPAPKKKLSDEDIAKILDVHGEKSLWGDKK